MVTLPTPITLGQRSPQPTQTIATPDRRIMRLPTEAQEAQGAAIQQIGTELNSADTKLDEAKAKSYYLQQHTKAVNSFQNDNDPDTYGQRYQDAMKDAQSSASGMIKDPMQRKLFEAEMATETARGLENVKRQAEIKSADLGVANLDQTIIDNRQAALLAPDEATKGNLIQASNQSIQAAVDKGYITNTQGVLRREKATQDYASSSIGMLPPEERIAKLKDAENGITKFIPADVNQAMQVQAENEIRKNQAGFRADLNGKVKDSQAMAYNGVADPNPPTPEDFKKAYGDTAHEEYQSYREGQKYAYSYFQLGLMKPKEQQDALAKMAPVPGDGYAEQDSRYQAAIKAVDTVNKQRQTDPMSYAVENGITNVSDLSLSDPHTLAPQLAKRAAVAEGMAQDYGTPIQIFTKSEASGVSKMLNDMSAPQKISYLKSLRDGITDNTTYRQALQQIRPGSPVTAMAGGYLDMDKNAIRTGDWLTPDVTITPESVAERLVQGEALINPTEQDKKMGIKAIEMPARDKFQQAFNTYTSTAFRDRPLDAEYALDSTRAYYASLVATKGGVDSTTIDDKLFQIAAQDVIGHVADRNGKILLPWGMDENTFDATAHAALQNALGRAGLKPDSFKYNDVGFINTGKMNQYMVTNGSSTLTSSHGEPIIMDLSDSQPMVE